MTKILHISFKMIKYKCSRGDALNGYIIFIEIYHLQILHILKNIKYNIDIFKLSN